MKNFSNLFLGVLAIIGLAACSSDGPDGKKSSVKMNRLNLDNAQYLTLGEGDNSRANSTETLFKVDADGNTSVVMLECVEQEDGSTKTHTYNLEVMPELVFNLTKSWMFLEDCEFYCAANEDMSWKLKSQYNEPAGSYDFHILANKKTGKVYYVPDDYKFYFFSNNYYMGDMENYFAEDAAGNLYTTCDPTAGLSKVTTTAEGAVITKLGPATMNIGGKPYPLPNGTVVTLGGYFSTSDVITAVYPNGGYEVIEFSNYYDSNISEAYLCYDKANNFNLVASRYVDEKEELQLSTVSVGTSYGSISVSDPLISHTLEGGHALTTWYYPMYMGDRFIIFGQLLAYDKETGAWLDKDWLGDELFIVPTPENTYQGRAWHVWYEGAYWMNLNTLETGTVNFDIPSELEIYWESYNVPGGEAFIYVRDPRDGRSYVYRIDIVTGQGTRSELSFTSTTVTLVPLN